MSDSRIANWKETILSYCDKRLLWIFMLACSSGYPWVIIGSSMSGWLKDAGKTSTEIGYVGGVFLAFTLNFFWAPLIDRVKIPLLQPLLGQRRSWIFFSQIGLLIFTLLLAGVNPVHDMQHIYLYALAIAVFAATQDIAIDAYRIDTFPRSEKSKLPQASAMGIIGWWTGYSLPGYLAFSHADALGWPRVYFLLAVAVGLLMLFVLLAREPKTKREQLQHEAQTRHENVVGSPVVSWLTVTVVEPFIDFFRRNGTGVALTLILFVFLFKIGEAFLGRMSIVFYKDIGFDNEQIAYYSKLIGWGATMVFTLLGSVINVRFGIVRGLMIGGIAMSASNLMFSWIASVGPNEHLLLYTIIVDNFTTAFSTVAFVSFLTVLTGQAFSATQYALLASLGNMGRTVLASFSGQLADALNNWSTFFIITAVMVIPSLLLLYSLRHFFDELLQKRAQEQDEQK